MVGQSRIPPYPTLDTILEVGRRRMIEGGTELWTRRNEIEGRKNERDE